MTILALELLTVKLWFHSFNDLRSMNLLLLEIYILYILLGLYIYIIEYIIIGEKIGKLDNCHIVGLLNLIFSDKKNSSIMYYLI